MKRFAISHVPTILLTLSFSTISSYSNATDNTNVTPHDPIPLTDFSVPLFAEKYSHHVHVYIGSPPQRRIVIVDTGSRLLVFPCEPCRHCGSNHVSGAYFDPKISSTDVINDCDQCVFTSLNSKCSNDQCSFRQAFTEGSSIQGYEIEDILWLGTSNIEQSIKTYMQMAIPLTFGCQSQEKGLIADQYADGIMGLSWTESNVITRMYQAGSIPHNAFSLCLTRQEGFLSLGGTLSSLLYNEDYEHDENITEDEQKAKQKATQKRKHTHLEQMKMVPISKSHGYYSIQIQDFHLGGISIQPKEEIMSIFNSGKGTIIDSGTSDTYLPKQIQDEFYQTWIKLTKMIHTNSRVSYTYDEFRQLPNITLTLEGGHTWTIQPNQYMEPVGSHEHEWTTTESTTTADFKNERRNFHNRIYVDEPNGAVLGANAMFQHDILFDMNAFRIGIAQADCTVGK